MLVLTVKIGEKLYIGDDIQIVVTQRDSRHLKIGIEAPKDVRIVREKLLITKKATAECSTS